MTPDHLPPDEVMASLRTLAFTTFAVILATALVAAWWMTC